VTDGNERTINLARNYFLLSSVATMQSALNSAIINHRNNRQAVMTTAGVTTYCNFHRMKKCLRINDAGKLERSSSICRRLDLVLTVLGGKDQSHNQPI